MSVARIRIFMWVALVIAAGFSLWAQTAVASMDTKVLIVNTKVGKYLKLVVDTHGIVFRNLKSTEANLIPASPQDIRVTVKARTGSSSPVFLRIQAEEDLVCGSSSIPVQNVLWQASGDGFLGGTLSKFASQAAGAWVGSGIREGFFRYFLRNRQDFQEGEYRVHIVYTLTAP